MKYFSEITNKQYDTPEECVKAEKEFKAQEKKLEEETSKRNAEISKDKKELAKAITDAETKLSEANKLYEVAQQKAADILEKSNKEVTDILETARTAVKKAEEEKLDAILNFNKKYGTYTTTYTGEKAVEEFNRSMSRFRRTVDSFLKNFWF